MSSGLDFDVKDRIKQSTDIVDLIGSDIQLRRQGSIYVGHCPWHDDSRPSFQVNQTKQSWVCWPCSIRGDVFDYVMRRESVDFREAMVILAERAGIALSKVQKKVVKGSVQDKQTLYKAMAWAEAVYHDCLLTSEAAIPVRNYLADRGITDESIETFQIGFAPLAWSWLVDRSRQTEFTPEILEACGLVSANQGGNWYERFRGRVIFPIRDTQQRPIALGGRVVPGLYGSEEEPRGKYVNSPETRLFSKSQQLFGLNLYARDPIARQRQLTVVEGYTDVVAAWQSGARNVVAALGTALNERHIRLLKRFADQITLVLDGDAAGQKRANEILDLFVAQDVDLRVLSLPEGMDPFDYFQTQGAESFQKLVATAPDAVAHKISTETAGIDLINDTHRANQALENVLKTLAAVPAKLFAESPSLSLRHDQIIIRLARQFKIDRERIRTRLNELRKSLRPARFTEENESIEKIDLTKLDRKESELVQILIQDPSLLDFAVENVSPEQFSVGPLQKIFELMDECFQTGKEVGYDQLMLELEDPDLKAVVGQLYEEATEKQELIEAGDEALEFALQNQLQSIVLAFQELATDSVKRQTISQLQERQLDEQEEATALEDLLNQMRHRQGLLRPKDG